jgi:hypothetical protein
VGVGDGSGVGVHGVGDGETSGLTNDAVVGASRGLGV